jgi:sulfur-carrier protein adenylyltransferase/sulfurtransferase
MELMILKDLVQLDDNEKLRYSRQIKLAEFGLESQLKLKAAKVLLAGAGGLGNPLGLYLAGAGVGTLGIADFDRIDITNLHRQVAFRAKDAGNLKTETLADAVLALNPLIRVNTHNVRLVASSVRNLIAQYDLVIDGTDSFASRFLLADACFLEHKPLIHGAVHALRGQIVLLENKAMPCFRCLYAEPPSANGLASCSEAGILGVVTGTIGLMMATEAVKYLAGLKTPSLSHLLVYDAMEQTTSRIRINPQIDCALCGPAPTIKDMSLSEEACGVSEYEISSAQAKELIASGAQLIDVREADEYAQEHMPNAISAPLSCLNQSTALELTGRKLVAYCQTGKRSYTAVSRLRALGHSDCYSIAGGISAWQEESPMDMFLREDR